VHETLEQAYTAAPEFDEVFGVDKADVRNAALWEKHLVFGQYDIETVLREVKDVVWQERRVSMLGTSHRRKWNVLRGYLLECGGSFHARCVVTNYVYALKRGGVIK
jgi:hypothetical protein